MFATLQYLHSSAFVWLWNEKETQYLCVGTYLILFFLFEFDLLVWASSCLFKHDSKIWPFLIVTFTSYVHTITYAYKNRLIIVCVRERERERRKKKEKLNLKKQGGACYNQIMNKSYIIEKLYMQLVINIVQFPICNCLK